MSRHQALGFGLAVVLLAGPVLAQNQAPQSKEALPWAQPAASADNKTAAKPDKAAAEKTATAAATRTRWTITTVSRPF